MQWINSKRQKEKVASEITRHLEESLCFRMPMV